MCQTVPHYGKSISLGEVKLPAAMLNLIQNGPDCKGKYHFLKKISLKYIFRIMSAAKYYIIRRRSQKYSNIWIAATFYLEALAKEFSMLKSHMGGRWAQVWQYEWHNKLFLLYVLLFINNQETITPVVI